MRKRIQYKDTKCALHCWCDHFRPSTLDISFTDFDDPGSTGKAGRYKGKPLPWGSATFRVPEEEKEGIRYLESAVMPHMDSLKKAGATEFTLSIGYEYEDQCALGFDPDELRILSSFGCSVHIDCWEYENEEID